VTVTEIRFVTLKMNSMRKIICFLCLLIAFAGSAAFAADEAEAPVRITAEADKDRAYIGDRVKIDIIATKPEGYEIIFPDISAEQEYVSFITSYPIDVSQKKGEPLRVGREYVVSIYAPGTHVIPPIPVKYRKQGEEEWQSTESGRVPIEVLSLVTDDDKDIRDIKGLIVIGVSGFWWLALLAVILAAAGCYLWWRCRVKRACEEEIREKSAYEIAYEQLMELKAMDLPGKGQVKEYYIRLSDIVRRYLEKRFAFKAPEMTTEEFLAALKGSPEVANEHKKLLKEFLSHCDMVKFAKYGPTPLEMVDSFTAALNLVEQTRLAEEEEGEE